LNLDERIQSSREVIGKHLATSQKKVSTAFNNLWNDIEAMREAQRIRAAEERAAAIASGSTKESRAAGSSKRSYYKPENLLAVTNEPAVPRADLAQTQATLQAASQRAGAYLSSWGVWAADKRKTGWGRSNSGGSAPPTAPSSPVTREEKGLDMSLAATRSGELTEAKEMMASTSQGPQPGSPANGDRETEI
jgi:hypothetical protein